jgi:hypothetical protein
MAYANNVMIMGRQLQDMTVFTLLVKKKDQITNKIKKRQYL